MSGREVKLLVLTDFSSGYSRDLLRGIIRYAQHAGGWTFYRIPLYHSDSEPNERIAEWADRLQADAIIVQISDIRIDSLRERLHIPILVQHTRACVRGVCNLTGDYLATGTMAAEYFISKGYTRFAYYGPKGEMLSREHAQGFARRLRERGFEPVVRLEPDDPHARWLYDPDALSGWLGSLPKPVGVFACDDCYALRITESCRMCGLRIPSQVAVLGVGNDDVVCRISSPQLSSIAIDAENSGYEAGKAIHNLIESRRDEPFDMTIGPVRVFTRESTQMYAVADAHIMQTIRYIEENYALRISVSELLKLVPLSRRVFEKRFRKHTGMPVYQFLQRLRIEKFTAALISSDKSVETIALACGFDDFRNVSRVFARYKGMSPTQYRRRFRRAEE